MAIEPFPHRNTHRGNAHASSDAKDLGMPGVTLKEEDPIEAREQRANGFFGGIGREPVFADAVERMVDKPFGRNY